jgi:hypothetical protein
MSKSLVFHCQMISSPQPPRPPPHAALLRQAQLKEACPLGALQTLPSPKKARSQYLLPRTQHLPPEKEHCFRGGHPKNTLGARVSRLSTLDGARPILATVATVTAHIWTLSLFRS